MLTEMQRENVADWKHRLLYGDYEQGQGYLKSIHGYCCLGVAVEVLGHEFLPSKTQVQRYGEYGNSSKLTSVDATKLGFDKTVEAEEKVFGIENNYIKSDSLGFNAVITRQDMLLHLNDSGVSFADIVDFVEKVGWDK